MPTHARYEANKEYYKRKGKERYYILHPNALGSGASKLGALNPNWKGDNIKCMNALHTWIRRHKPKPVFCEECHKNQPYDVANISGQYLRDVNDYRWLCRKCHMLSDGRMNNLKQFQE